MVLEPKPASVSLTPSQCVHMVLGLGGAGHTKEATIEGMGKPGNTHSARILRQSQDWNGQEHVGEVRQRTKYEDIGTKPIWE